MNFWIQFGVYGAVGFQLAGAVVFGLLSGHYLDGKLNTSPWLAVIGLILGAAGGFYNLFRILKWYQSKK